MDLLPWLLRHRFIASLSLVVHDRYVLPCHEDGDDVEMAHLVRVLVVANQAQTRASHGSGTTKTNVAKPFQQVANGILRSIEFFHHALLKHLKQLIVPFRSVHQEKRREGRALLGSTYIETRLGSNATGALTLTCHCDHCQWFCAH